MTQKSMPGLEVGYRVLISTKAHELAAEVTQITPPRIRLKLSNPTPRLPFKVGDPIRIQYTQDRVLYCWNGKVDENTDPSGESVWVSVLGEGITVQARKTPRFEESISVSFTVFDAAGTTIIGTTSPDTKTRNLSVNGLLLETDVPLEEGDQLAMRLNFAPSSSVKAFGWVTRSERVTGEGKPRHEVGVEFLQFEEGEQVKLLKFLLRSKSDASGEGS